MIASPFIALFERLFSELRAQSAGLPAAGAMQVEHFVEKTHAAVLAVVVASESLGDVPAAGTLSHAAKIVSAVERLGALPHDRKVAALALALIVVADPDFEDTFARVRERQNRERS